jgi:hypothetical protein
MTHTIQASRRKWARGTISRAAPVMMIFTVFLSCYTWALARRELLGLGADAYNRGHHSMYP